MNTFSFHKMHGLGNDFMVVDNVEQTATFDRADIALLADRYRGVGFDQLLLISPSKTAEVYCQIFNADGSEAEQCGNGMRCIARFLHEEKIISKHEFTIETKAGLIPVQIKNYDQIRVNMGVPVLAKEAVKVMLGSEALELETVSLGNPHAIARVENLAALPLSEWGRELEKHSAFPQGVNLGFMEVLDKHHIRLRTYERGVGETRACGSNACAAVISGVIKNWLSPRVEVMVSGGKLWVEWAGKNEPVFLTGAAARVYSGELRSPLV